MKQTIGLDVTASLNADALQAQVNQLGQRIAQANKVTYQPIDKEGLATLDEYQKRLKQLMAVSESLRKRAKATGQGGANPLALDFESMYPNPTARNQQMLQFFKAVFGGGFQAVHPPAPAPQPPKPGPGQGGKGGGNQPPPPPPGGGMGGAAMGAFRGALGATGQAGGIASGAIGVGLSAGVGAGLFSLIGGLLQSGISKVMERLEQAEDNSVAMDRLKRVLGDVNVSFKALETVVQSGAQNMRITYGEAEKLTTQFVKLGNVTGDQHKTLASELEVGVGLSRSFGMDPSQGMGVLGQMRGLGVTKDTQESRRFALLIGETIGKAGAFAKADEVMDAIANFATSQTRQNMGAANVAGFAGQLAGMAASGIAGMDVQGAAGMLAKINSTLASGGAKGEASQFFTGIVGNRMGLDPIQTQILREGGAFATNSTMFGEGSAAARYGMKGPGGDKTFLQASLEELRRQYGGDKGLLAQATSNHLGVGINQAMALLSVDPKQIGEMQSRADLSKLSAGGIGNMAKALYGSSEDRQSLAQSLLGRQDVSEVDKRSIEAASGNDGALRDVLARLTSQYDQERTTGSDIRDSKNALDNIKTSLASHLIPLTQEMRHGIMYLAGHDKNLTPEQIMKDVVGRESQGRIDAINGRFGTPIGKLGERQLDIGARLRTLDDSTLETTYGRMGAKGQEIIAEKKAERRRLMEEQTRNDEEITRLKKEQADLLDRENARKKKELDKIDEEAQRRATELVPQVALGPNDSPAEVARLARIGNPNPVNSSAPGRSHFRTGGSSLDTSDIDDKLAAADKANGLPPGTMRAIMEQEIGGNRKYLDDPSAYHYPMDASGRRIAPHTGRVSTAFGPFGILESTAKDPGYGVAPLRNKSLDEQIRFTGEYLGARTRSAGSLPEALAGYGEGDDYSAAVMARIKRGRSPVERGPDLPPVDPVAKPRVPVPNGDRVGYTPLPAAAMAREAAERSGAAGPLYGEMALSLRVDAAPGLSVRSPQGPVTGRFSQAAPFGTNTYA